MKNRPIYADMTLLLVAIIWGSGFIAREYALNANFSPLLIMALRFGIASLMLLAINLKEIKSIKRSEWVKGGIAGIFLFAGFSFQSVGQSITTISNSALITASNVTMIPFVVWIMTKKKPKLKIMLLAFVMFIGVVFLTVSRAQGFKLNIGDLFILMCAIGFACHIAYLEIAVHDSDPKKITFIQTTVASILAIFGFLIFEAGNISRPNLSLGLPPIIFLGVLNTCLCFLMQTSAQKKTNAAKAGIILSTEGFFGTLFSILLGMEPLTAKVVIGGTLILTAVVLTEVKFKKTVQKNLKI